MRRRPRRVPVIRLRVDTDLTVNEPNEDDGLVVRWRVAIVRDHDDDVREDVLGSVSAWVIQYGGAVDVGAKLDLVMAGSLEPLHRAVFTEDGWLREDFEDASGSALLYIETLDLSDEWRDRLVDLAVVHRLGETIGQGCSLTVLNGTEARRTSQWGRIGFALVAGAEEPFLALNMGKRIPHLRPGFDDVYEVVPSPRYETPSERADERAREGRN